MKKIGLALACLLPVLIAAAQAPVVKKAPLAVRASSLPASVDNTAQKYFPPLIDQKGGSCAQASAIGYMFTYEMNRLLDRDASASAAYRFSYQYTYNFVNDGEDNGSFGWDGLSIASANGIITEADWPSSSASSFRWASGYEKYFNGIRYKVKSFEMIDIDKWDDLAQVKQFLYDRGEEGRPGGIVVFSTKASNWKMDNNYTGPSTTDYHTILTALATEGGHALTIAGYDDLVEFTTPSGEVSKGAFIVVNTWGSYSHDNGRFYLPYWFFFNNAGSAYLSPYVTTVEPKYEEPKIVFKVGVECDSRNDLSFKLGVSDKASDTTPKQSMQVRIADYQGGDYPMQGSWWPSDIEFGFDFSAYASTVDAIEHPSYFLTVARNKRGSQAATVARLTAVSVYDYRSGSTPVVHTYDLPEPVDLSGGDNVFSLSTVPPAKTSYSPVEWLNKQSRQPVAAPLVVRTADGKFAKVRLSDYDRTAGTIRIKFVYNPNGGRNLQ